MVQEKGLQAADVSAVPGVHARRFQNSPGYSTAAVPCLPVLFQRPPHISKVSPHLLSLATEERGGSGGLLPRISQQEEMEAPFPGLDRRCGYTRRPLLVACFSGLDVSVCLAFLHHSVLTSSVKERRLVLGKGGESPMLPDF